MASSYLCATDTVAKLPLYIHEARRLSCGRVEGVEAVRHHVDAVDAEKFGTDAESAPLAHERHGAHD